MSPWPSNLEDPLFYAFDIIGATLRVVEIQPQHWLDRLCKPRTGSVRLDRCANQCENREAVKQIFREGIYLGVSDEH